MFERAYIIEASKNRCGTVSLAISERERKTRAGDQARHTRDVDYMWDDLVSICTTTPTTPAHSVQQRERCPGRVCRSAPRDTYDAEVCHGGEILYFYSVRVNQKNNNQNQKSEH